MIVGRLTKSNHFLLVKKTFLIDEFRHLYVGNIVKIHGMPLTIVQNVVLVYL